MKLELSFKNTILLSVAVFLLLLIAGYVFLKPSGNFTTYFVEDKFAAVSKVQLAGGEKYVYNYSTENDTSSIEYDVTGVSDGCAQVNAYSSANRSIEIKTCFNLNSGKPDKVILGDSNGIARDLSSDDSGLLQPWMYFDFFQPWMLGAKEGFTWNTTKVVEQPSLHLNSTFTRTYNVTGTETKLGRTAYKVEVFSSEAYNSVVGSVTHFGTMWIDEQKRVLLEYDSENGRIMLTSAPFGLTGNK